jgi:hypothetical protein
MDVLTFEQARDLKKPEKDKSQREVVLVSSTLGIGPGFEKELPSWISEETRAIFGEVEKIYIEF